MQLQVVGERTVFQYPNADGSERPQALFSTSPARTSTTTSVCCTTTAPDGKDPFYTIVWRFGFEYWAEPMKLTASGVLFAYSSNSGAQTDGEPRKVCDLQT